MPAAKGRKLGLALAALVVLAAAASPAGASIPRPGDQLSKPDPGALLAAVLAASPDAPRPEAPAPGRRFELLGPPAVDRLLFTGRPQRLHLFAELETCVRASDLLNLSQPSEIKELIHEIAPGDRETRLYYARARYYDPELGLFLTQDPFEGVRDTPPSLHRYLYAFGNPMVYVDPSGRIAILKAAQEKLQQAKEAVVDFADSLDDDKEEQGFVERKFKQQVATAAGAAAGLVGIVDEAVGAGNFVVNAVLVDRKVRAGIEVGDLTRQAEDEILEAVETAEQAIAVIKEDPLKVGSELFRSAKDTLVAAGQGDTRAIAEVSAAVTQVVVDVAVGSKGTVQVAKSSRRVGKAATELVEAGGELALREGKELVEAGGEFAIRRTRQAGRTGRELFEELPEAGSAGDDIGNLLRRGEQAAKGTGELPDLPVLDATGKVHGRLPDVKDLGRYDADELLQLRNELELSVQKRIEVTVQKGSDFGHAERQAAEQQLIKSIEKHLENR